MPGDRKAEVGGDWFDAIQLAGRRVALVVGDVMGHGLHSAAAMGRFRTAMQTLAALDLTPGQLPRHLDNLAQKPGDNHLATCLYAVYDPINRTCEPVRRRPCPAGSVTSGPARKGWRDHRAHRPSPLRPRPHGASPAAADKHEDGWALHTGGKVRDRPHGRVISSRARPTTRRTRLIEPPPLPHTHQQADHIDTGREWCIGLRPIRRCRARFAPCGRTAGQMPFRRTGTASSRAEPRRGLLRTPPPPDPETPAAQRQ
jgi:hypothetical protein